MYSYVTENAESYVAAADLSAEQYTFVKRSGAGVVQANAGEAAVGVLWNAPLSGHAATVVTGGRPMVIVGTGGLTAGQEVASDNEGLAVAADSSDVVLGIAMYPAAAGGYAQVDLLDGKAQYVKA
jgi:hypothetical protein